MSSGPGEPARAGAGIDPRVSARLGAPVGGAAHAARPATMGRSASVGELGVAAGADPDARAVSASASASSRLGPAAALARGDAPGPAATSSSSASLKPRAIGPRHWLRMNEDGTCVPETIDKHRLASRLRVPMRDLRMLEPNHSNSYSAAILSRERCMVVHLEQVRLLITAEEVYVQDGRNPAVTRYLPELQRRLLTRKLKLLDSHGVPAEEEAYDEEENPDRGRDRDEDRGETDERSTDERSDDEYSDGEPRTASDVFVDEAPRDADVAVRGGVTLARRAAEAARRRPESSTTAVSKNHTPARAAAGAPPAPAPATLTLARADDLARLRAKLSPLGWDSRGGGFSGGDDALAQGSIPAPGSEKRFSEPGSLRKQMSLDAANAHTARRQEELPFELIALEVALEVVCNHLEAEQKDVAEETRRGLDGLRKKVSTANLERVRRIKSRVTRMTGRCAKVREEIKRYLDDDSDMRDMYLTRKLLNELFAAQDERAITPGLAGRTPRFSGGFRSGPRHSFTAAAPSLTAQRQRSYEHAQMRAEAEQRGRGGGGAEARRGEASDAGPGVGGRRSDDEALSDGGEEYDVDGGGGAEFYGGGGADARDDDRDVQEVEDLLETYFAHVDGTFAELEALDEFIDDTEDFVNIELDSQRNQLIKLELVLTTATLFVSVYGVVASVFGMNLRNGSEDSKSAFVLVNVACAAGTVLAFVAAVTYIRFKRIV